MRSYFWKSLVDIVLLLLGAVILRSVFQQPTLLNFRDVPNERLVRGLHDFVEYNPIGFAILMQREIVTQLRHGAMP